MRDIPYNFRDKLFHFDGVVKYLNRFEVPDFNPNAEYRMNKLFKKFFDDKGIEGWTAHNSPRYKGSFRPSIQNSSLIQENWGKFCRWCHKNFKKKQTGEK